MAGAGDAPLTARAQARKQEIIRTSEALFSDQGYAQTRMSDIADAAGVTKGLLYWYFESKEALVAEVLVDIREQLREAQRRAVEPVEEPLAKVYVGTVASVRFVLEHARLFQVNIPGSSDLWEVYGASAVVHAADTAAALLDGQQRGSIRVDDTPHALAVGNAGIVNEYCLAHSVGRLGGTVDDVAHQAARYVVRGLASDSSVADAVISAHGSASRSAKKKV
jgi:AcrR family transcriptional regulator